jgi:hypothetical protein
MIHAIIVAYLCVGIIAFGAVMRASNGGPGLGGGEVFIVILWPIVLMFWLGWRLAKLLERET